MSLLYVALLSLLPISELRGGIPLAISLGVNPVFAFFYCVFFNILVIPVVFLFLDSVHKHLTGIKIYNHLFNHFLERTRKRTHKKIEKFGYMGLALLVAIPLPITGAYTGTLAAWLFNIRGRKAYIALISGVVIAGAIVTAAAVTSTGVLKIFVG
jgi:uncharacterized membrane protein